MSGTCTNIHTKNLISFVPNGSSVKKEDIESLLTKVHEDDRVLVGNVIRTMQVLRTHDFVHNFEVVSNQKGYDVIGTLSKSFDRELIVTAADFEVLQSVNPTRVSTVMVQVFDTTPSQPRYSCTKPAFPGLVILLWHALPSVQTINTRSVATMNTRINTSTQSGRKLETMVPMMKPIFLCLVVLIWSIIYTGNRHCSTYYLSPQPHTQILNHTPWYRYRIRHWNWSCGFSSTTPRLHSQLLHCRISKRKPGGFEILRGYFSNSH